MKIHKLSVFALLVLFALIWAFPAFAQESTPEAPVTVVVEAPAPVEPIDTTVQSFLFAGLVLAGIGALSYVFKQHGVNLEVVSKTVPIEFAQFAFRQGMTQALSTPLSWDDDALKELAKQAGYNVIEDGRGGFTIVASPTAVAQNTDAAKEAYERSKDR